MDAYIIYACSGKFKTWVRIPPSVLGVYTVEFSLREECTEHLKDRVQGVKSFFQFKARKTGVVNEISLTYKLFLRDVSGLDHPFHVKVTKLTQGVVTNCGSSSIGRAPAFQAGC